MTKINFVQSVPDSHWWSSLEMLLHFLEHYKNGDVSANYLIIGLENARNRGYQLSTLPSAAPVKGVVTELVDIRNKLYNDLPTGEINSYDLLQIVKWHINDLDNFCSRLSSFHQSLLSQEEQDVLWNKLKPYVDYGGRAAFEELKQQYHLIKR